MDWISWETIPGSRRIMLLSSVWLYLELKHISRSYWHFYWVSIGPWKSKHLSTIFVITKLSAIFFGCRIHPLLSNRSYSDGGLHKMSRLGSWLWCHSHQILNWVYRSHLAAWSSSLWCNFLGVAREPTENQNLICSVCPFQGATRCSPTERYSSTFLFGVLEYSSAQSWSCLGWYWWYHGSGLIQTASIESGDISWCSNAYKLYLLDQIWIGIHRASSSPWLCGTCNIYRSHHIFFSTWSHHRELDQSLKGWFGSHW